MPLWLYDGSNDMPQNMKHISHCNWNIQAHFIMAFYYKVKTMIKNGSVEMYVVSSTNTSSSLNWTWLLLSVAIYLADKYKWQSKRFPLNHGLWASCIAIIWEVIRNTDCPALTPNQGKMKVHFNKVFSVCVHSRLRNTPLYKIAPHPLKELGGKSRKKVFHTAGGRASDCSASVRKSRPDLGEALEETWPVRGVQRWPGFSISVQSLFRISLRE